MPRGWFGKRSEDFRKQISDKLKGRKLSDDHRTNIGNARRGKTYKNKDQGKGKT